MVLSLMLTICLVNKAEKITVLFWVFFSSYSAITFITRKGEKMLA